MARITLHADASNALEMLDRAARLRAGGESFELALRLDDDRGSVAAILAQNVCRTHPKMDLARLAALDQIGSPQAAIGENPLVRFATMDLASKATMRDLAALADSLIFRSWAEMRRGVMDYDIIHRSYTIAATRDERVPQPQPRASTDGSILIWAPDEPVERLYIVLTAAAETGRHVRVVARAGDLAAIPAEIIAPQHAAHALERAAVCVIASLADPSAAIGLAGWNIPICATFTSGAQEWITPLCSYRSWSRSSAFAAITHALAMPAPAYAPSSAQYRSAPVLIPHDALVTIVVRVQTEHMHEITKRSILSQTYPRHEVLLVSSSRAARDALAAAQGRYVLFIDDGDILFSDHLATLVEALEISDAHLAYAGGLLGYLIDAPGTPTVFGYSVMEKFPVSEGAFAAVDEFAGTYFRVLFRREPLQQAGLHAEFERLAVFDAFSRMLAAHDAVHVDRVGGMAFRLLDGRVPGEAAYNDRSEYETYYRLHPVTDSAVSGTRAAILLHLARNSHIGLRPPPQRLNPPRPF